MGKPRLRKIMAIGGKWCLQKPKTHRFWKRLSSRLMRRMNDDPSLRDADQLPQRRPYAGWQD